MASKRVMKELDAYRRDPSQAVVQLYPPNEDDLLSMKAVMRGPDDTDYQDGTFVLALSIPPSYPSAPPAIRFETRCAHPNVDLSTGAICLDLLQTRWTPAYGLVSALEAVHQLLAHGGEADSPLNLDLARMVREGDVVGARAVVRWATRVFARGDGSARAG